MEPNHKGQPGLSGMSRNGHLSNVITVPTAVSSLNKNANVSRFGSDREPRIPARFGVEQQNPDADDSRI
jgi:hypothetical protein